MKSTGFLRAFAAWTIFFSVVAGLFFGFAKNSVSVNAQTDQADQVDHADPADQTQPLLEVTTITPSTGNTYYIDTIGVAEPLLEVAVFPATNGQIRVSSAVEGAYVNAGEPLFELGGVGGTVHPVVRQSQQAILSYQSLKAVYENTIASTEAAIRSAELQLQSAQNQTQGSLIAMNLFDVNLQAIYQSRDLIAETLDATREKNARDRKNLRNSISDLEDAINQMQDQQDSTLDQVDELLPEVDDDDGILSTGVDLVEGFVEQQLNSQLQQLESQKEQLESQLENLGTAEITSENQIIAQLQQLDTQEATINVNRTSAMTKLGYNGYTSPSLDLARTALEAAKIQSATTIAQIQTQLDAAEINMLSTSDQEKNLIVRAPITGRIASVNNVPGDIVAPSAPLVQIVDEKNYIVRTSIDINNSRNIPQDAKAGVKIGGQYVNLPIRSISPVANPNSRLVSVTITLPPMNFKANEAINVKLPISPSNGSNFFIPLDAVTIGTEEKHVFLVVNGKVVARTVEIGQIAGNFVEILSGLSDTDEIIVGGAKLVQEGQPVNVVNQM